MERQKVSSEAAALTVPSSSAACMPLPSAEEIAQRAAKSAAGDIDERLSLELVAFGERRGDVVDRRGRVNGELEELHTLPEVDEGH